MSKELLHQILRESEFKIQHFQQVMSEFEQNPMILVTDILVKEDPFLPFLIARYGEEALLDIQSYWFRHFLPKLKQHVGIEEISYHFDQRIFPSLVHVHQGEEAIAIINFYTHQFERLEEEVVLQEKLKQLEREKKEIEQELKELEPALKNPLVLGGANVLKLLDIALRQKKYKKEVREKIHSLQDDFFEIEKERVKIQTNLQNLKRMNIEREYLLDRLEQRITQLPGFVLTSPEDLSIEDLETMERGFE